MNRAADLLRDRSSSYLLDVRHLVERPLSDEGHTDEERSHALELGRTLFVQLNALLKVAIDTRDRDTFLEVERKWAAILDQVWVPDDDTMIAPQDREVRDLLRYRDILRLGLAMWATHLTSSEGLRASPEPDTRAEAIRVFAGRFSDIEQLLDTHDRATERDDASKVPWTNWFLSELHDEQAHFIPTSSELLFTTLLLSTRFVTADSPDALRPRDWLRWRLGDVGAALDRLAADPERWRSILGPEPPSDTGQSSSDAANEQWLQRIARLRELFTQARDQAEAREQAAVRESPLDATRVAEFRRSTLRAAKGSRLIRDLFEVQGGLETLSAKPADRESLVSQSWLPKNFFTPNSQVVALDLAAGDLGRSHANEEITQLLATLPDAALRQAEGGLGDYLSEAIGGWRQRGGRPSLLLLPIGWELKQALGVRAWRGADISIDPLIPPSHRSRFSGTFEGVPVLDLPQVPTDRLWLLDLSAAARYVEWPSEEDSGLSFELQTFTAQEAAQLLDEHPEAKPEDKTVDEAILDLQERVLLKLYLCWSIERVDSEAAIAVGIPEELRWES